MNKYHRKPFQKHTIDNSAIVYNFQLPVVGIIAHYSDIPTFQGVWTLQFLLKKSHVTTTSPWVFWKRFLKVIAKEQ